MPSSPPASSPQLVVSIVIHHSNLQRLQETLVCLDQAVLAADVGVVTTVVVDQSLDTAYSAQAEQALQALDIHHLLLDYVRHDENRGYGAGHNFSLGRCSGEHVLILNPDVALDANALRAGLKALVKSPEAVLAAPVSRTECGEREYLAKDHPSVRALAVRALGSARLQRWNARELARYEMRHLDGDVEPSAIVLASGACMLIRGETLQAVGGFDESYFLYFEDYDLSLRCAAHGQLLQVPDMKIVHHGGGAARKGGQHIRWFIGGGVRFFRRWGWRWW